MKNPYFIIALILIFIWSFGFIGYGVGGAYHVILVIALLLMAIKVVLELRLFRQLKQHKMKFHLMKFKLIRIKLIN